MSQFLATYTVTRRRVIVETATASVSFSAEDYGNAGDLAEEMELNLSGLSFEPTETSSVDTELTSISKTRAAPAVVDGLTPAVYEPSPQLSGGIYYPVQVEPTPID